MNITMIGVGYVGFATGVGFASKNNEVIGVCREQKKADKINSGKSLIYEPGISEILGDVIKTGHFRVTTDLKEAIMNSDVSFICVGTPSKNDGSIDLTDMKNVSKTIGEVLKSKHDYHVVVVKSTVVSGTTENIVIPLLEEHSGKKAGESFGVCMNPEFLREGKALDDFLKPDRIVIGEFDKRSGDLLERTYSHFDAPVMRTKLKTAEMIKYASNSLLAAKISYANEVGNICKLLGIDVYDVMKGVGLDHRLSPHFLRAGCGFGGSCFPKDVSALVYLAKELNYPPELLEGILNVNKRQKTRIIDRLESKIGSLENKKIAILGLAFNPETDDTRESPAIEVINSLKAKGAKISAYDPKASENMKNVFPDIEYNESAKDALKESDACLILTDWKEFKELTDDDFALMKNKIILEGRRILNKERVNEFEGICW